MLDLYETFHESGVFILGDIPIWAFHPQLFQFGSLYSNLVPFSNSSIPI
eukprot:COSAG01_NODE_4207_length_5240_cov_6.615325_5_plen_48_part_01